MRRFMMIVVLMAALPASAELYRWVDDKGQVHFGDRPPANGQADALEMPKTVSTMPALDESRQRLQQDWLAGREEERRKKQEEAAKRAQEEEKRVEQCRLLAGRLRDMERTGRYYRYDDKGERVYVEEAEVERVRNESRTLYSKKCPSS